MVEIDLSKANPKKAMKSFKGKHLAARIFDAIQSVEAMSKDKTAPAGAGGYSYVSHVEVSQNIKHALGEHRVLMLPSEVDRSTGDGVVGSCLEITFINVDNPDEEIRLLWGGQGPGRGDKGLAIAQTYALKQFLLKTFQVDTDRSLDAESHDEPRREAPTTKPKGLL